MELEAAKLIAAGLMSFSMLGAAIGVGLIFAAMLQGVARNPSALDKMKTWTFIGMALSEAMGIFGLGLAAYLIFV